ncbi:hypothetical protein [Haladaptatus sp. DFWS20]|uniref:hypothetical protein n=1 Tax=Haladaptatus sp. DFWS20 TaxID=3403467 RepID=UPI003EBB2A0B
MVDSVGGTPRPGYRFKGDSGEGDENDYVGDPTVRPGLYDVIVSEDAEDDDIIADGERQQL